MPIQTAISTKMVVQAFVGEEQGNYSFLAPTRHSFRLLARLLAATASRWVAAQLHGLGLRHTDMYFNDNYYPDNSGYWTVCISGNAEFQKLMTQTNPATSCPIRMASPFRRTKSTWRSAQAARLN